MIDGKPATDVSIEMYYRSDRFAECLRLMLDHGGTASDRRRPSTMCRTGIWPDRAYALQVKLEAFSVSPEPS